MAGTEGRRMGEAEYRQRMNVFEALSRLLAHTPIEAVRVGAICQEAGVSRSTFYRYFTDKYSVVEWHFDFFAVPYTRMLGVSMNWKEAFYGTLEVLESRTETYTPVFLAKGMSSFRQQAIRLFQTILEDTASRSLSTPLDDELQFQIAFTAHMVPTMVSDWFKAGQPFPREHLIEYLDSTIPRRLHSLLNR